MADRLFRSALIVVDIQNDFLPGGALAVSGGDEIIPVVNRLMAAFDLVVLTQDWHPADHLSFAVNHPSQAPFSAIETENGPQVLWPSHCVAGTPGADFSDALETWRACLIVRKGCHKDLDSYSGFIEQDGVTTTGLAGWLREMEVGSIFVCGLATDFCVAATAVDGRRLGFEVALVVDASKAIDTDGSLLAAGKKMADVGVRLMSVDEVLQGSTG